MRENGCGVACGAARKGVDSINDRGIKEGEISTRGATEVRGTDAEGEECGFRLFVELHRHRSEKDEGVGIVLDNNDLLAFFGPYERICTESMLARSDFRLSSRGDDEIATSFIGSR